MTKVSTNAGKHPYLRVENGHLFANIGSADGKPLAVQKKVKFNVVCDTNLTDKNKKKLFYRDIVIFDKEEYEIGYDSREFQWNMVNINDSKKVLNLAKNANLITLKKKYVE